MTLTINVTDVNDNRPIFNIPQGGYQASVFESAPVGFEAITVEATDLDTGDSEFITYAIDTNVTGVDVPFAILDPRVRYMYRHACNIAFCQSIVNKNESMTLFCLYLP